MTTTSTSIQYVATLSPEDGSFFTQVTPAVRAAFVVLFDICLEVYPEATTGILLRSIEEVLKDPRITVNKSYASRVRRMVYEFTLVYPGAFYGRPNLEALQTLVKTRKGEDPSSPRPGTCRSPWVRSLVENLFKQAMLGITPESHEALLKDWVVLTRKELKDNRQVSDFKELAEIVLARFDCMHLFQELLTSTPKKVLEVDASQVEEAFTRCNPDTPAQGFKYCDTAIEEVAVTAASPAADPAEKPFEEFFETGVVTTASPEYQIYPGYNLNYQRNGRTWAMYLDMVDGPHRVKLDVFEDTVYINMLASTYRDAKTNRLIHEGGKVNFGGKEITESNMSSFVMVEEPVIPTKDYRVWSYALTPGNEYIVTVWKNIHGLGDTDRRFYLISFFGDAEYRHKPNWTKIQELEINHRKVTLWESPRLRETKVP